MNKEIIILALVGLLVVWRFCLWLFKDEPVKPVKPPVCKSASIPSVPTGFKPSQHAPKTPFQHAASGIKNETAGKTKPRPKPKKH